MDESFFTQDFETFAKGLSTFDIALYAGVALVLWTLFKDKLSPITSTIQSSILNAKNILLQKSEALQSNTTTKPVTDTVKLETNNHQEDVFLKLVVSWKQTRELALLSGCKKAVEVADEMFPFLSPTVCAQKNTAVTNRGAENV